MKKAFVLVIITIPFLGFVLKPLVFVRGDIKIDTLLVLSPVTHIAVISKGGKQLIDGDLSKKAFFNTGNWLRKSFPDSVKTKYFSSDSITLSRLDNFVADISRQLNSERQARKYQLPDSILTLFDSTEVNFVFCTYNIGFKRTRDNLINTHLASEIADFLIGFNQRPLESSAAMTCFILDLRQKNILFFERHVWGNKDPTDINVIKLQLSKIITHCFI